MYRMAATGAQAIDDVGGIRLKIVISEYLAAEIPRGLPVLRPGD